MPTGTKQEIADELTQQGREILTNFHEKIILYSAGSISLSTTLLGFLLNAHAEKLRQAYFFIPNIHYLFLSWIAFSIALLAGLYSRRRDADFLYVFGTSIFMNTNVEEAAKTKDVTKLIEALADRRTQTKDYLDRLVLFQRVAETTFPVAILFLLVFTVFTLLSILK